MKIETSLLELEALLNKVGSRVLDIQRDRDLGANTQEKTSFHDITTLADIFAEEQITAWIRKTYPDHSIRGEEQINQKGSSGYEWLLDPIDGTTNFASGMDQFGISAGLTCQGQPIAGVINYPALGVTLRGMRNRGVFLNGNLVQPNPFKGDIKQSLLTAGIELKKEYLYGAVRSRCRNAIMSGSFVVDFLWLIQGKIAGMFHTGATPFDLAAGLALTRELGYCDSGIEQDNVDLSCSAVPVAIARNISVLRDLVSILNTKP